MDLDYIDNDNSIMERLRQKSRRIFGTGFKGYSGGSWDRLVSNRGRGNMDEIEVNVIDKIKLLLNFQTKLFQNSSVFFNNSFLFLPLSQSFTFVDMKEDRP